MAKIVVDPITRIEGHLRIEAEVNDGRITDAWSASTMFRGIEKILKGHCDQQLLQIMEVPPDDPNRQVKLNAISETAYSMQLFLELARQELGLNWKYLEAEELRRHKEAEKNAEELRKGNERTSY